jgi:16S rRNA (cytidine1402-2'-O)-methyltransferase
LQSTNGNNRGTLFVISTPIGNLSDITFRAIEVLKEVDYVACEDTRITLRLLNRYNLKKSLLSVHTHTRGSVIEKVSEDIKKGKKVAYLTDSGTPGISDPGIRLIQRVLELEGEVVPIPGPSAVHSALIASGILFSEYTFFGFLSSKKSKRRRKFEELKGRKEVWVFFESPHRIISFLEDAIEILGDVSCCVAKEMTKKFERFYRGRLSDVLNAIRSEGVRGEYTVVIDNR